ncbi:pyridoxine 5'-phosphate synthase [Woeseiaceae bacterium]|jgi:pyridoxine 5-phosphate synthase|nr:pyridoxine 5'-phosphate synthase [Woeseiaceae bacterium]MDB2543686.1 pyridoxine 5'-phosphate synthase [Woeseiaceae bacterium]
MENKRSGKIDLGVNVDHIATLRQARKGLYPNPVEAALRAEKAGADSITMHLREDRRHIQKEDIYNFSALMQTHLNLEMAVTDEMLDIACDLRPQDCCLVPESREELTTEGGLDVFKNKDSIADASQRLGDKNIRVSLFIDPDFHQIDATIKIKVPVIELHTGTYADATGATKEKELQRLVEAAYYAHEQGLIVNAGHGLDYQNVAPIAQIDVIKELNIGHSIIAFAAFEGLDHAIQKMMMLMSEVQV